VFVACILTSAGGLRATRAVLTSFSLENYLRHGTPGSASPGPVKIENDTRGEQRNGISSNLTGEKKMPSHLQQNRIWCKMNKPEFKWVCIHSQPFHIFDGYPNFFRERSTSTPPYAFNFTFTQYSTPPRYRRATNFFKIIFSLKEFNLNFSKTKIWRLEHVVSIAFAKKYAGIQNNVVRKKVIDVSEDIWPPYSELKSSRKKSASEIRSSTLHNCWKFKLNSVCNSQKLIYSLIIT
jgi:hypothetical protein